MTREDKWQLWKVRLLQQVESGLTVTTWCEQNHIAQSQFYYWQKKVTQPQQKTESAIVPISMSSPSIAVVIETPSGYRISVNDTSVMGLLPDTIKALP